MYYLSAGVLASLDGAVLATSGVSSSVLASLSASGMASNMLFVTLGNIVGGALFVGGAYAMAYRRK